MAIYKSSFNKKPEENDEKKKTSKVKPVKEKAEKPKTKIKVNKALIFLFVFSIVLLLCCVPGNFIKSFILGLVGLLVYPICVIGMFFSACFLRGKKFKVKKKYVIYLTCSIMIVWFIFHLILTSRLPMDNLGTYLAETYKAKTTAGGILFSFISYPLISTITYVGAYIFSAIGLAIFVGLIVDYINVERSFGHAEKQTKFDFKNIEEFEFDETPSKQVTKEEQAKKIAKRRLGLEKGETTILSSNMPNIELNEKVKSARPMSKREYILTPIDPIIPPQETDEVFEDNTSGYSKKWDIYKNLQSSSKPISKRIGEQPQKIEQPQNEENLFSNEIKSASAEEYSEPVYNHVQEQTTEETTEIYDDFILDDENEEDVLIKETYNTELVKTDFSNIQGNEDEDTELADELDELQSLGGYESNEDEDENPIVNEINIRSEEQNDYIDEYAYVESAFDLPDPQDKEIVLPGLDLSKFNLPKTNTKNEPQYEQVRFDMKPKVEIPAYILPPVELLKHIENPEKISDEQLQDNIDRLELVLEDFKVPAKVSNVQVGPAVTRYELSMPRGISVNRIAQIADDIAMTLASNGAIRVEAPIPGKNLVGIEVPNDKVGSVSLRELIDSNEYKQRGNPLSFVLGKDINGTIIFCNLDKMPHLLVAGSTGSGKSVCLNVMLLSMCYKSGPQDLRLILVDPKMVEFATYAGLPHLLIPDIITNKDKTINALDWAIKEMERRYALFAKHHVVNINEYNRCEFVRLNKDEKLPFIVIVVDELADLMLEAKREIEDKIAKLAAKARAAGIHLVLATQRPSVDVITGTVKANLPSRIAFALTNYMDSKTVLDGGGADKLLGKGDMLFKPQDKAEPVRVQGAFVSSQEISSVIQYIKEKNTAVYDEEAGKSIENPYSDKNLSRDSYASKEHEFDPILKEALRMFIQTKQASGSMISRRYSVGYNRAGRIMDQMEQAGFIGPQDGAKPRTVLISMDEYKAIFGDDE